MSWFENLNNVVVRLPTDDDDIVEESEVRIPLPLLTLLTGVSAFPYTPFLRESFPLVLIGYGPYPRSSVDQQSGQGSGSLCPSFLRATLLLLLKESPSELTVVSISTCSLILKRS
ncbi:hypothetical protein CsSME_00040135 [Camellia sinensis var. sinensis]